MICTTVREGVDCGFMKKTGCSYTGGSCHEIVEQCKGCNRIMEIDSGKYCMAIPEPEIKWRNNAICNMATHVKAESALAKVKINPLKASKRAAKKK